MIELLMITGVLMILSLLFPRMYGQRVTRGIIAGFIGGLFLLVLLVNDIFFSNNQADIESSSLVAIADTVPELPVDVETPLVVIAVDTVPDMILDRETKQVAVAIIGKLSALGVILKIDPTKRIIYIDPTQWISVTSKDRKSFCVMSAIYFTIITNDEELKALIKNAYSNRVCAKLISGVIFYY